MMQQIENIKGEFDQRCDQVGEWLDQNPTVYKVVLLVNHFFRAAMIYAMLALSPLPVFVTAGLLLVPSLMYRIAVERFCVFRFTLPAWAGGVAMWMAASCHPIGIVTLAGYAVTVMYISYTDVEGRMNRLKAGRSGCCS